MEVSVGTFNLNNLFSRFNFAGAIEAIVAAGGAANALTLRYEFTDPETFRVRTFKGKLVRAKPARETEAIARRILAMDVDVLAVQEVEDLDILRSFNRQHLGALYPHQVLVEGNDPRFIDVGVLSKLPIGAITSHQTAEHPEAPGQRVFSRDLLEVEVLHPSRGERLFTLYNTHLKSHFVEAGEDPVAGAEAAAARRRRQAETLARVIAARQRPDARYMILGDMNDPVDSPSLAALRAIEGRSLTNGLATPVETRPAKTESSGDNPLSPAWSYRHKASGQAAEHHLYDQIWLSAALGPRLTGAFIDRRTRHAGDGSDHDPAWVRLEV
jgi:endonuclease/exonuclease/phosphatase family metal-dependent hydrolase